MAPATVALYGHWICPFSTRVEFALHQRGIAHELIELAPTGVRPGDSNLPEEFLAHSPRREVPMVRIGDEYLADSIPILEWLEERIDDSPLLPTTESELATMRERMVWINDNAFRPMAGIYYGTDVDLIEWASSKLGAALDQVGSWTHSSGWLAGDRPTLAEAVALPIYVRIEGLRQLGFTAQISSETNAHIERCQELAGWEPVAWTNDQTTEFVERFQAFRAKNLR